MLSKFLIKFEIILIFVEILEPPIMHVIGFVISEVIFFKAFISSINCKPQYDGIYLVIPSIEECAL